MPECSGRPVLAGHEHRVACWLDPASRAASEGGSTSGTGIVAERALS
jgi:hypothetical protein